MSEREVNRKNAGKKNIETLDLVVYNRLAADQAQCGADEFGGVEQPHPRWGEDVLILFNELLPNVEGLEGILTNGAQLMIRDK